MSAETQTGQYVKCLSQLPDLNRNWCVCVCVCVCVWTHERTEHTDFLRTCFDMLKLLQEA